MRAWSRSGRPPSSGSALSPPALLQRAYGVPFPVALAAAAIAGGMVGFIIALLSLRLRALYVAVTTLVLHFAVTTFFSFVQAVFLDSTGIILPLADLGFMELQTPTQWYYFLLAVATLIVLGALNLLRSFIGRRWIAVGEHDLAAEALGVSVRRAKLSVFTVTSAVTAFAGALVGVLCRHRVVRELSTSAWPSPISP